MRLSKLASKRGADEETQQLSEKAESLCPQMGWKECSVEKIQSFLSQINTQSIFFKNK